jgi:hypothetical protein
VAVAVGVAVSGWQWEWDNRIGRVSAVILIRGSKKNRRWLGGSGMGSNQRLSVPSFKQARRY